MSASRRPVAELTGRLTTTSRTLKAARRADYTRRAILPPITSRARRKRRHPRHTSGESRTSRKNLTSPQLESSCFGAAFCGGGGGRRDFRIGSPRLKSAVSRQRRRRRRRRWRRRRQSTTSEHEPKRRRSSSAATAPGRTRSKGAAIFSLAYSRAFCCWPHARLFSSGKCARFLAHHLEPFFSCLKNAYCR